MAKDLEIKQDKDGVDFTFPIPDDPKAKELIDAMLRHDTADVDIKLDEIEL